MPASMWLGLPRAMIAGPKGTVGIEICESHRVSHLLLSFRERLSLLGCSLKWFVPSDSGVWCSIDRTNALY